MIARTHRKEEMWKAESRREAEQDVESRESPGGISIPGQDVVLTATQSLSAGKPSFTKLD